MDERKDPTSWADWLNEPGPVQEPRWVDWLHLAAWVVVALCAAHILGRLGLPPYLP